MDILRAQYERFKKLDKLTELEQNNNIIEMRTYVDDKVMEYQQLTSESINSLNDEYISLSNLMNTNIDNIASIQTDIDTLKQDYIDADSVLNNRITNEVATINKDYDEVLNNLSNLETTVSDSYSNIDDRLINMRAELDTQDTTNANSIIDTNNSLNDLDIRVSTFEYDLTNQSFMRLDRLLRQKDIESIEYDENDIISTRTYVEFEYKHNLIYIKESYIYNTDNLLAQIDYIDMNNDNNVINSIVYSYDANNRLYSTVWS